MKKTHTMTPHFPALICLLAPLLLASCGGGGGGGGGSSGGGSTPTPPAPTPGGTVTAWKTGVYEPASTFKNKCAAPRTGADIEGTPFQDTPGTLLHEKNWLRSWTQETYLWNTEVADLNPALYPKPTDYFAMLRTVRMTASGRFKDEHHFSQPTSEFLAARNSAAPASYGMTLLPISLYAPRDIRVAYVEPNSPASQADGSGHPKIQRGARILTVNGMDLVYGGATTAEIDLINNALFPSAVNTTTTFTLREVDGTLRTVTLTSANVQEKPVNQTQVFDTPTGKVGYILFNTFSPFSSEREIVDAMQSLSDQSVSDLVLDLRYNSGGLLAIASQLSYMIAGPSRTDGKIFEKQKFNASAGNLNPVTGKVNTPVPFLNTGLGFSVPQGTALPNLNLSRVFVLATDMTCSASEAVINSLRGIDVEVILIGNTTCGKPYGFYAVDNCGETYFTIQFEGVNNKDFGDYADGFVPQNSSAPYGVRLPGCEMSDDLAHDLGNINEGLLATALAYRQTNSCPAPLSLATRAIRSSNARLGNAYSNYPALKPPSRSIMDTNRDMTMPGR